MSSLSEETLDPDPGPHNMNEVPEPRFFLPCRRAGACEGHQEHRGTSAPAYRSRCPAIHFLLLKSGERNQSSKAPVNKNV